MQRGDLAKPMALQRARQALGNMRILIWPKASASTLLSRGIGGRTLCTLQLLKRVLLKSCSPLNQLKGILLAQMYTFRDPLDRTPPFWASEVAPSAPLGSAKGLAQVTRYLATSTVRHSFARWSVFPARKSRAAAQRYWPGTHWYSKSISCGRAQKGPQLTEASHLQNVLREIILQPW